MTPTIAWIQRSSSFPRHSSRTGIEAMRSGSGTLDMCCGNASRPTEGSKPFLGKELSAPCIFFFLFAQTSMLVVRSLHEQDCPHHWVFPDVNESHENILALTQSRIKLKQKYLKLLIINPLKPALVRVSISFLRRRGCLTTLVAC